MDTIWEETRRDVSEERKYKKKMHALSWEIYVKEKEELINRNVLASVPHPKGGNIVWTCVNNHITNEKDQY